MAKKESRFGFAQIARWVSDIVGTPQAFAIALLIVGIWAVTGPAFQFSNTWQLVINTGTTILTFLMVFVIQNTQNRDTRALQIKLDELIRANSKAHNDYMNLEELDESDLKRIQKKFEEMAEKARAKGEVLMPEDV